LRPQHHQEGYCGDRPGQTPQRRDRHVPADLPGTVHALRQLRAGFLRGRRTAVSRLIRAVIDAPALRHNLKTIRARAGRARVMAVVKANAYGHGLVPTALELTDADAFAVARLEEGLALRAAGIAQPVVLLEGVFSGEQLREAARHGLDFVVHDALQIELLERFGTAQQFVLWVKIDTGMNRLGFAPAQFAAALSRLRALTPAPR